MPPTAATHMRHDTDGGILRCVPSAWLLSAALTASPVAPTLEWSAAEGCPDREVLVQRVQQYAAHGWEASGPFRAQVDLVTDETSGYALQLRVTTTSGTTRTELMDADCDVLVDAAAMKIALALDELDEASAAPAAPTCPSPSPPAPAAPTEAIEARPPEPEPAEPLRWVGLSAMAGIDWGTLPGIGPVFVGTVALVRWPRLRIEAGGIWWSRRDFWVAGDPSQGGALRAGGGLASACGVLRRDTLHLDLCGGIELSSVHASGLGADRDPVHRVFRAGVVLAPALRWVIGQRVGLVVAPAGVVPLVRYAFELPAVDVTYRARPVALRATLGVEVRL